MSWDKVCQCLKFKYRSTNISIQMQKYKDTNVQMYKYKFRNIKIQMYNYINIKNVKIQK